LLRLVKNEKREVLAVLNVIMAVLRDATLSHGLNVPTLSEKLSVSIFYTEDGARKFLRNVDISLLNYMPLHLKSQQFSNFIQR
jgi:hypothetical protein